MVERDIYEVANQLEGYVDPGTPEPLARFLLREGKEAAKLADTISTLRAENEQLRRERDAQRTRQEERVRVLEEARSAAHRNFIDAWEALPVARDYNFREVEAWLLRDMKPAVDRARAALGNGAGDA